MTPAAMQGRFQTMRSEAGASCIEKGQACTLHGTECCGTYECKGTFPNTTCQ